MGKINRIVKKDGQITKTKVEAPQEDYKVRISAENYQQIVLIANEEGRSVTKQVNYMLAQQIKSKHA